MARLGVPWSQRLDALLVATVAFGFYLVTLAPTVTTGDSGELVTAAATLGVPHPTGYPFYLLLGRAFIALLWFLPPALAMNLFSALCAAIAVALLDLTCLALTNDRAVAGATALLLAFSTSLWSEATTARTYPLNAALVAAVLLLLARAHRGQHASLALCWGLLGLALANHTVAVVLVPPLALLTWQQRRSALAAVKAAAWCLPGLCLYLYLPLAASFEPSLNWGDPSTLENLFRYLTRAGYWERRFVTDAGDLVAVVLHYLRLVPVELTWPGAAALAVGAVAALARDRAVVLLGAYLFVANLLLMVLHGSRADIFHWPRYMITAWLGLLPTVALGLAWVHDRFRSRWVGLALLWAPPVLAAALHLPAADRSGNRLADEYNRRILDRVEPGAVVFAEGDNVLFPLIYLHHAEGLRPDVRLVLQGVNQLSSMTVDPDREPVYFTHHHQLGAPQLELVPDGLVYRLTRAGSGFESPGWSQWAIPSFEAVAGPGHLEYLDRNLCGDYLLQKALNLEERDPGAAGEALQRAMRVDHDNPRTFANAGLILERSLRFEEALTAFERAVALDPRIPVAPQRVALWHSLLGQATGKPAEVRARLLAAGLLEAGRLDLALRLLDDAVARFPQSAALRYNRSALLILTGRFADAERELEACLGLEPTNTTARRDLDEVRARVKRSGENHPQSSDSPASSRTGGS